ncbi:YceI family protein [Helicobacter suis]|uniref:YceI family protein n=1 Tax=Helicobacter suis TaxID=104628 RepID=UPI0013D65267|nr:YceI family protein [Helicobacter suis]
MRFSLISLVLAGFLSAATYSVDVSHSNAGFEVRHMLVAKVEGNFSNFSGKAEIEKGKLKALEGVVQIKSISTKDNDRDTRLRSSDFFDATRFPQGTLKAISIQQKSGGILQIQAKLKLKDVEKTITLKGKIVGPGKNLMDSKEIYGLELQGSINRKDFGIGKDIAESMVGNEILLRINLEVEL